MASITLVFYQHPQAMAEILFWKDNNQGIINTTEWQENNVIKFDLDTPDKEILYCIPNDRIEDEKLESIFAGGNIFKKCLMFGKFDVPQLTRAIEVINKYQTKVA